MVGLRFHSKIEDVAYLFYFKFKQYVLLDMFFVFFSIDVVFLDDEFKILEIKENFKPFTFYGTKCKVNYVIELPLGYVKKYGLKIGEKVEID